MKHSPQLPVYTERYDSLVYSYINSSYQFMVYIATVVNPYIVYFRVLRKGI